MKPAPIKPFVLIFDAVSLVALAWIGGYANGYMHAQREDQRSVVAVQNRIDAVRETQAGIQKTLDACGELLSARRKP